MKRIAGILLLLPVLIFAISCFEDAQEPQPQPKTPPPNEQLDDFELRD